MGDDPRTFHARVSRTFLAHKDVHEGNFMFEHSGRVVLCDFGATAGLAGEFWSYSICQCARGRPCGIRAGLPQKPWPSYCLEGLL